MTVLFPERRGPLTKTTDNPMSAQLHWWTASAPGNADPYRPHEIIGRHVPANHVVLRRNPCTKVRESARFLPAFGRGDRRTTYELAPANVGARLGGSGAFSEFTGRIPPFRSPLANAYAERFVRTAKESCLNRMIFFGEDSLRRAVNEFLAHYHHERNHQGLGNRLIDPREEVGATDGSVTCRERLGGLLRYYYRQAA